jgi:hypothetical protein
MQYILAHRRKSGLEHTLVVLLFYALCSLMPTEAEKSTLVESSEWSDTKRIVKDHRYLT